MNTLEYKVDLIMRYIVTKDNVEATKLKIEMQNLLREKAVSETRSTFRPDVIEDLLKEIGVQKGHKYYDTVADAIYQMSINLYYREDLNHRLYVDLGKRQNVTSRVIERRIRNAIEGTFTRVAWSDEVRVLFGNTIDTEKGKPTNLEFLLVCADEVNRRIRMSNV